MSRKKKNRSARASGASLMAERAKMQPLLEHSAGGVVFKVAPRGIQVAFQKDPYGRWTFAKGHVEDGEALEEAAVRETQEEMGLRSLRIIAKLGTIELWFTDRYRAETKGRMVHKYVHYFLLQAAPGAFGRPQASENIKAMTWVTLDQVMAKSSYEDAVPILQRALRFLRKREVELGLKKPNQNPAAK